MQDSPDGSSGSLVVVAEDVWGEPYQELATTYPVVRLDCPAAAADLSDASGLVVRNQTQVNRALLEAAPYLQVVARAGAGMDNIDVDAAEELGVVVVGAPGANATSVAEHTIGLALAVARRTVELDRLTRAGHWRRDPGYELTGGVWGLLSAGATARATARLARAFGMEVVAYDPYCDPQDPELADLGVALQPLREVVRRADVLSVHLPSTGETRGMVGAALLQHAKSSAIVINVGRGEVVDEGALLTALRSGRLAGAALDVRSTEPPVRGELEELANVVLTPHVAGITHQSQARISELVCRGVRAVLEHEPAPATATRCRVSTRTVPT